jgi:hypothetical protein
MIDQNWPYEPVTVNKDGSVVIETKNAETGERRQIIFRKIVGGDSGLLLRWELSTCQPGVGTMPISISQANVLAYALRAARGGDNG